MQGLVTVASGNKKQGIMTGKRAEQCPEVDYQGLLKEEEELSETRPNNGTCRNHPTQLFSIS